TDGNNNNNGTMSASFLYTKIIYMLPVLLCEIPLKATKNELVDICSSHLLMFCFAFFCYQYINPKGVLILLYAYKGLIGLGDNGHVYRLINFSSRNAWWLRGYNVIVFLFICVWLSFS
ncbi:hypothetical protein ACRTDJ_19895, partial [Shewanella algae]